MRVLHVASWYPRDITDLAGVFVREHVRCLVPYADQLVVVPSRDGDGTTRDEGGVRVIRPRFRHHPGSWLIPYIAAVSGVARDFAPDVLHAHVVRPAGVACLWAAGRLHLPYVVTEHTGPLRALFDTHILNRAAAKWAFCGASTVTSVSASHAADIGAAIPSVTPVVIPNTVDVDRFGARRPGSHVARLLFIGRLVSDKGVGVLVEALAKPSIAERAWTLTVVGAGPEEPALRQRAGSLGDRIRFLGYRAPSEIPGLLSEADILVLPSLIESFGVVVIEALAAGVPVLATRCGGPDEVVTAAVGRLAQPGDVASLAGHLEWMIDHHRSFSPERLRAYASESFGFPAVARQLLAVYASALSRRN